MRLQLWLILIVITLAASACQHNEAEHLESRRPQSTTFPSVQVFDWGNARIEVGMTRAQVLEQIDRSGRPEFNGYYGINTPPKDMVQADTWRISFGNGSGAAPGGGVLQIRFVDNSVVEIVAAPVFA